MNLKKKSLYLKKKFIPKKKEVNTDVEVEINLKNRMRGEAVYTWWLEHRYVTDNVILYQFIFPEDVAYAKSTQSRRSHWGNKGLSVYNVCINTNVCIFQDS